MAAFEDSIWCEYPIPQELSVWSGSGLRPALVDLTNLIVTSVRELQSDITIPETIQVSGLTTILPEDAVSVSCARLSWGFQGSRLVKYSWCKQTRQLCIRYFPATVTYRRKLHVEDLDNIDVLEGDQYIYVKTYILMKMAEKELHMLKGMTMKIDNGELDMSVLSDFVSTCHTKIENLKKEILIYSSNFN